MNATLTEQFEGFAECCLELARGAETTERRARFIQMAHEYRLATLLKSLHLARRKAGDFYQQRSHLFSLLLKHPPRAPRRARRQGCSRAVPPPRHPGFKAQMFDDDKQNRDFRIAGGNAEGPDT